MKESTHLLMIAVDVKHLKEDRMYSKWPGLRKPNGQRNIT